MARRSTFGRTARSSRSSLERNPPLRPPKLSFRCFENSRNVEIPLKPYPFAFIAPPLPTHASRLSPLACLTFPFPIAEFHCRIAKFRTFARTTNSRQPVSSFNCMVSPEDKARESIDKLLTKAGWTMRNQSDARILAYRGIAIRDFTLKQGHSFAENLLYYVDGRAAAVIKAKKEGVSLTGGQTQVNKQQDTESPSSTLTKP